MILPLSETDIVEFKKECESSGLIFASKTEYYGLFDSGVLCGFGGILAYKDKVVFKSLYVFGEYRRKGVFKKLLSYLISLAVLRGVTVGEANCTPMSINEFISRGFFAVNEYKNCTKVKSENL